MSEANLFKKNKSFSGYEHLNPEQKKAVQTTEGRVLILAGAGSGKTSVLACRIAYLIQEKNVPSSAILGLTFTNKAAREMKQRVEQFVDPKLVKQITLCTFHSFCMQVLKKEIHHLGYTSEFSLYDEQDVKRLIRELARHLLQQEGDLPSLEPTLAKISYAKTRGLKFEVENPSWHDQFSKELYEGLHRSMRAYNAVDFDSLLSLTVELFENFPEVLNVYQKRFRYIMIDEYQDTNPIQYRLSSLLAANHQNLCVVGDDDQSIYGWRGAEIQNILHFDASTVIKLEQNYRSTPTILSAANAVIRNNEHRHAKQLWSTSRTQDPLLLFHAPTDMEEAQSVAQRIIHLHQIKKLPWKEIAVLYRSNILSRPIELALMQAAWEKDGRWVKGIPYQVFGGTEFFERSEIKDLIAYLKAILNPLDEEALLRIINVPRRGISEEALDLITKTNRSQKIPLWEVLKNLSSSHFKDLRSQLSERALKGIASFVEILQEAKERFKQPPLEKTFEWFLEKIHYKKAIFEEVKSDKMREFKWENVLYCQEALAQYEQTKNQEGNSQEISLHDFLTTTLLDREKMPFREKDFSEDKINLMTFHSAKGLEFTACFLVGLEDHIIPHEKSAGDLGIEEERRLMYVAMTRAKQFLILSMARKRKRMGKEANSTPSRFLFEIPKELIQITSWKTTN